MIDWIVLGVYLGGIVPAWRWAARRYLEWSIKNEYPKSWRDEERGPAKVIGFFCGLFWPFVVMPWMIFLPIARIVFPNNVRTRDEEEEERRQKEQEELVKLRNLAKEYNLPGWE